MKTPDRIWLLDLGDEITWCDSPDPSHDINLDDTVEYVKAEQLTEAKDTITTQKIDIENAVEAGDRWKLTYENYKRKYGLRLQNLIKRAEKAEQENKRLRDELGDALLFIKLVPLDEAWESTRNHRKQAIEQALKDSNK